MSPPRFEFHGVRFDPDCWPFDNPLQLSHRDGPYHIKISDGDDGRPVMFLSLEMSACQIGDLHYKAVWQPVEDRFRVQIRSGGFWEHRPLLGTIMLTSQEWESVVTAANKIP